MRWAALLLVASTAHAAKITAGPYVQDAAADAFTLVYETDTPVKGLVVVQNGGTVSETQGTHHEARVVGLAPAKRYPYQVKLDGQLAASGEARTLPEHEPLTFVVYGDTRQGGAVEQAVAKRILGEAPDFAVHTGDLVRKGSDETAWLDFFDNERPLLASVPVFPVFGNHEKWGDPAGELTARFFPDLREKRWYSFTVAGSRFILLDGNAPDDGAQLAWLKDQLEQGRTAKNVFVFVHQPPFSLGDHCGSATSQTAWVDLFEQYRVRAVFAGHDHAYERMERNGVRYFVTGGGGAPLYDEQPCAEADRAAKKRYVQEYHYLRVKVSGDEVSVTAERVEPNRAIEAIRLSPHDSFVAEGPPLKSERRSHADDHWKYATGTLIALVVLGRFFFRRRRLP